MGESFFLPDSGLVDKIGMVGVTEDGIAAADTMMMGNGQVCYPCCQPAFLGGTRNGIWKWRP
jgi:hypothetical protein